MSTGAKVLEMAKATKGDESATQTQLLRAQAVQYMKLGWSYERIGKLLKRSPRTIRKWATQPDVKRQLGKLREESIEAAQRLNADVSETAWRTLQRLMVEAEDEKVQLEAAKTVLSRKGEPEMTKSEVRTGRADPPASPEEAEERLEKLQRKLRAVGE